LVAKKPKQHRVAYSTVEVRELKAHMRAKKTAREIAEAMGRTAAAIRMKARQLGLFSARRKRRPGGGSATK
jgi:hypothetical protein